MHRFRKIIEYRSTGQEFENATCTGSRKKDDAFGVIRYLVQKRVHVEIFVGTAHDEHEILRACVESPKCGKCRLGRGRRCVIIDFDPIHFTNTFKSSWHSGKRFKCFSAYCIVDALGASSSECECGIVTIMKSWDNERPGIRQLRLIDDKRF